MLIKTILNNNAVRTVLPDGSPAIVVGRGVGYRQHQGGDVDPTLVEQTFIPRTREGLGQLVQLLQEIPIEHVRVAAEITDLAIAELGVEDGQSLLLPIADHLNFVVRGLKEGQRIDHPLKWEVQTLYPKEAALGRRAVSVADDRLRTHLPEDEAISFALHFMNAQFAGAGTDRAYAMTRTIQRVFDMIEKTVGQPVDQRSMGAARFVTHLRYLFVRLSSDEQLGNLPNQLVDGFATTYPLAASIAKKVAYLFEIDGPSKLTGEEVGYLTLHIARLLSDMQATRSPRTEEYS